MDNDTPLKRCSKCQRELHATLENFPPDKKGKYGLFSRCRPCQYRIVNEARTTPEGRDKERKRAAEYQSRPDVIERRRLYAQRPDQKAKRARYNNEWRRRFRERYNKRMRLRILNNPEQRHRRMEYSRDYNHQYRQTEHGKQVRKVHYQKRRAAERSLVNDLTVTEWESCLQYFGHKCAVCGATADFWTTIAQDHWIPLSKGGGTTRTNIVPLCHARKGIPAGYKSCNLLKGSKEPQQWLVEQFGEKKAVQILARINEYFDKVG